MPRATPCSYRFLPTHVPAPADDEEDDDADAAAAATLPRDSENSERADFLAASDGTFLLVGVGVGVGVIGDDDEGEEEGARGDGERSP